MVVVPTDEMLRVPVVEIAAAVVTVEQSISKFPLVVIVPAEVLAKAPVTQLKSIAFEVVTAPCRSIPAPVLVRTADFPPLVPLKLEAPETRMRPVALRFTWDPNVLEVAI
jgi:hypothetical protein